MPLPEGRIPQHHAEPRQPRKSRSRRDVILVTVSVAVAALLASAGGFVAVAERDPGITLTTVGATADTYVVQQYPRSVYGSVPKLTAAQWRNWNTEAYVLFDVPAKLRNIVSARVELTFQRRDHQPAEVRLHRLPTSGWSEDHTSFSNRPPVGEVLATAAVDAGAESVSFDIAKLVRRPGRHAFALTNPGFRSVAAMHAREQGGDGPRLILGTLPGDGPAEPAPTGQPTKPPAPTPSPSPTKPGTPPKPPPPPPPPAPPPAPAPPGSTLCGASFASERSGESYQEALKRLDGFYNGLEMVRIFYPGRPAAWPGKLNVGKRPIVVSFKFPPNEVTAGKHDAFMRSWFDTAPRDQDVYWTYWHEPEDDIANGRITSAGYRAAWKHLRGLADQARNDRLSATLILMGWSLSPSSRRNWRDYYAGRDVVQVLGWDIYNPPGSVHKGRYQSPAELYRRVVETSRAEELPFGIGETGSYLAPGDQGAGRADWLRDVARHLTGSGALWVAYFDLNWPSGDFRLRDQASIAAWREFCS